MLPTTLGHNKAAAPLALISTLLRTIYDGIYDESCECGSITCKSKLHATFPARRAAVDIYVVAVSQHVLENGMGRENGIGFRYHENCDVYWIVVENGSGSNE